ncbi:MAG: hypothetical protein CM1200mP13_03260 [Candidatus Pelagibacterales bacterium]|nr:MAG: hypothetical protein CM1200mP13_03260 [Pelagibacterales bacterium]
MGYFLSGQDFGEAFFSQRHGVLYDQENENRFVPLRHFTKEQGLYEIVIVFYLNLVFLVLNMDILKLIQKLWFYGKHNLVILPMALK